MVEIRVMKKEDYNGIRQLWNSISGFAIRSLDDSREGIEAFIRRNPDTSVVAVDGGRIVGTVLCGNDGRRATFYHVCVSKEYRKQGIGRNMVAKAMEALKKEGVCKITLLAFTKNEMGNHFWKSLGWKIRDDVNYYEYVLNEANVTRVVP